MSEAKRQARAAARARRRSGTTAGSESWARMAERLVHACAARRIGCFASYGDEPDTAAIPAHLAALGCRVWLPRVRGEFLDWVEVTADTTLRASSRGIPEPTGATDPEPRLDLVLVPALAVDRTGGRLGQGGGFYDRFLATVQPRPTAVAVVYDEEVADAVTTEPHDQRMDGILTPTRLLWC